MKSPTNATSGFVIPHQRVVVGAAPIQISVPKQFASGNSGVRLERDGDLVRVIEVTCSCGELIRLMCDYGEPQEVAQQQTLESFQKYANTGQVNRMPEQ